MNTRCSAIVADGLWRLMRSREFRQKKAAIETQVMAEYSEALAATNDYWERVTIEHNIEQEVDRRIRDITPSPYSLWGRR